MANEERNVPSVFRKQWRWLAVGGALTVAAAVTLGSLGSKRAAPTEEGGACEARVPPRLGAPGGFARYALSYKAQVCSGNECASLVELDGALEARAHERASGRDHALDMRFVPKSIKGDVTDGLPSADALSTPMRLVLSPQGSLTELRYERQVDGPTVRLLESVMRELQVIAPPCDLPGGGSYSAVENLVSARVMSRFESEPSGSEIRWQRAKVLVWNDASDLFPLRARSSELGASQHTAQLDRERHILRLSGRDEFQLQGVGAGEEMLLRVSVELTPDPIEVVASAVTSTEPLDDGEAGFVLASTHSELADRARVAGHDLTSVLSELTREKQIDGDKGPSTSRLFVAASALLRRDESAAENAAELIRDGHPEQEFLLLALGNAGTVKTAALLADLLDEAESTELQSAVLNALGRTTVAERWVVESMAGKFADATVGGSARLMTGALAYRTRLNSPATSDFAVQVLLDDYSRQTDVRVRADALRALGNAGSVASLRPAAQAAKSSTPMERAAAAESLRRVPSDAADRLLALLAEDPVEFVRRSALAAALYRDPTERLETVVARVARLDTAATVRREAIRALVRWRYESPRAQMTLAWIAANDPELTLRSVAVEGLGRFAK